MVTNLYKFIELIIIESHDAIFQDLIQFGNGKKCEVSCKVITRVINAIISFLRFLSISRRNIYIYIYKVGWPGRFVRERAYVRENSYSWANDVDGEIVIRLACRGTIKLLVGTLCTTGCFIACRILVPSCFRASRSSRDIRLYPHSDIVITVDD